MGGGSRLLRGGARAVRDSGGLGRALVGRLVARGRAGAIDAREHAYRLYKEAGDLRGNARMAIWLGNDHIDFRGEEAVARGWFARCERILDELEPSSEHGWLAALQAAMALDSGLSRGRAARGRRPADRSPLCLPAPMRSGMTTTIRARGMQPTWGTSREIRSSWRSSSATRRALTHSVVLSVDNELYTHFIPI